MHDPLFGRYAADLNISLVVSFADERNAIARDIKDFSSQGKQGVVERRQLDLTYWITTLREHEPFPFSVSRNAIQADPDSTRVIDEHSADIWPRSGGPVIGLSLDNGFAYPGTELHHDSAIALCTLTFGRRRRDLSRN